MKIRDGFLLKEIADSFVVVPVGENLVDFSSMITLNETAAFAWSLLSKGINADQLMEEFLKEYDVDEETAREDILGFVSLLDREGLLEK